MQRVRLICAAALTFILAINGIQGQTFEELIPLPAVLPPPSTELEDISGAAKTPPAAGELESLLPAEGDESASDPSITPTPLWYYPSYWFGPEPWDAGIELGINGSQGINDVMSLRVGGHARREVIPWKLDSSIYYNQNTSNGVQTQSNGKQDLRLDRILAETRWTAFFMDNIIFDEFQSYDLQLSLNSGFGYQWIKLEHMELMTRVGAGATREVGGVDNDWAPEALLGIDYQHKLSKMQSLKAKVDYFPEWEDQRNYRVVGDFGWQIDLDRPKNVSLKLSLIDRYDSTPNGAVRNSFDYAVLLLWKL